MLRYDKENPNIFIIVEMQIVTAVNLHFLPIVYKGSLFSTSWPKLVTCCLFDSSHPNCCKVTSHCGFNLHFPDDGDTEHIFMCLSVCIL